LVLEGVEACARAVVASRGRADRIIEEERFGGMEEGDSSGMASVIMGSCLFDATRTWVTASEGEILISTSDRRSFFVHLGAKSTYVRMSDFENVAETIRNAGKALNSHTNEFDCQGLDTYIKRVQQDAHFRYPSGIDRC